MTSRWQTMAALAALVLSLGGIGSLNAQAAQHGLEIGEQVFAVAYDRIAKIYLDSLDLGTLAADGLAGLSALDPAVRVESQQSKILLMRGTSKIAEFAAQPAHDAAAWAALTVRAIEKAKTVSARLRAADGEEILQAVFDSIMADLDSYSRYTGAHRALAERAQREGYGGVGISVEETGTAFAVAQVQSGSPAARAGIRVGDLLTAIDGDTTDLMSLDEIRDHLMGPTGSIVLLTLSSKPEDSRRIALRRERVIPNTVTAAYEDDVVILKIDRFNAATSKNLREAVGAAQARLGNRLEGLILDLRGNPGGLLDQAVAVADLFIPKGRIVATIGRHPDSVQRFDATKDDLGGGLPLVVLVDGKSASAAEIVAAALQDSGRAIIVGASSYGKGSVQTVTRLPNDGELFLTWSRIYAPSGYTLHLQGVTPTICTSRDQHDAEQVIAELRDGLQTPPSTLVHWRIAAPEDETALTALRSTCPWKSHRQNLDLEVAKMLIGDPPLYRRAMQMSSTLLAER